MARRKETTNVDSEDLEQPQRPDSSALSGQSTHSLDVSLQHPPATETDDLELWVVIRNSTKAMSFNVYQKFMDYVLCGKELPEADLGPYEKDQEHRALLEHKFLPYTDFEAYQELKLATEAFVMVNCGVNLEKPNRSRLRL